MDVLDKIKWLTDKQQGLGIPMVTIGRYCGCHPTTITYYLKNPSPKPEILNKYENGINNLYKDIINNIGE